MNASGSFGMLKYEGGGGWPRACDACHAAAGAVYCRADDAYLCGGCDARVHHANRVASRHERVPVCEACERAPAALTCSADAAALCADCDADVHSANPLARRHRRFPFLPLPPSSLATLLPGAPFGAAEEVEEEAASWLLFAENCNRCNREGFFGDDQVDEYLDLVGYNACKEIQTREQPQKYGNIDGSECVVPSQCQQTQLQQQQQNCYGIEMEYEMPNADLNKTASISQGVSFTSMDVSVVPHAAAAVAELSNPLFGASKGGGAANVELFAGGRTIRMLSQFPADREARVLRYREKRKARKFDKTIRYVSRKAYAETRPRIKGRFAKSSDVQQEMINAVLSTSLVPSDGSYGIVPSFR